MSEHLTTLWRTWTSRRYDRARSRVILLEICVCIGHVRCEPRSRPHHQMWFVNGNLDFAHHHGHDIFVLRVPQSEVRDA